jgi:hypothetical protein
VSATGRRSPLSSSQTPVDLVWKKVAMPEPGTGSPVGSPAREFNQISDTISFHSTAIPKKPSFNQNPSIAFQVKKTDSIGFCNDYSFAFFVTTGYIHVV